MERLTVFDGEFWVHKNFPPVGEDTVDEFVDCVKELAARLAAYEDTGLEPEEVKGMQYREIMRVINMAPELEGVPLDRLRELAQADRDGRCVVLPCKVGGTMWANISFRGDRYRKSDRPYPVKVVHIGLGAGASYFNGMYSNGRVFPFEFGMVGKTVFMIKEEAEQALKEAERND